LLFTGVGASECQSALATPGVTYGPNAIASDESSPEKAGVGGSIPSLATIFSIIYRHGSRPFHSISFQKHLVCRDSHLWNGTARSKTCDASIPPAKRKPTSEIIRRLKIQINRAYGAKGSEFLSQPTASFHGSSLELVPRFPEIARIVVES